MRVNTGNAPGAGITSASMQFHGTSDRYLPLGATTIATLYSSRGTATLNPAVTLRSVGSSGGQAAAFTYDLARSVVYTRQGNPAWAGQERDGVLGVRPNDMFFSTWLNTSKIAIPQADEQQRLLANLITVMVRDRLPMPRFWYLPRGEKAVVVMSGDDHSPINVPVGGTAFAFERFKQLSPPGCVVANWDCVRSTSYIYPESTLTEAEAAAYVADGFEVALHPSYGGCTPAPTRRRSSRGSSRRSSGSSARGTPACPHRSPIATTASSGWTGRPPPSSSSSRGSGWTRTTTTSRAPGSAPHRGS